MQRRSEQGEESQQKVTAVELWFSLENQQADRFVRRAGGEKKNVFAVEKCKSDAWQESV